ncbi:MAG: hypothetical protein Q7T01_02000 [bacterium]|nr:hypothetical protein [bacterium]
MHQTQHRLFEQGPRRGDMRPYFFRRDVSDVMEEAFRELLHPRAPERDAKSRPPADDDAVRREQYATLFAYDPGMRKLFENDFDAFCVAMDDPARMEEKLAAQLRDRRESCDACDGDASAPHNKEWDSGQTRARAWEQRQEASALAEFEQDMPELSDDALYNTAFKWACACERWSRQLLHQQQSNRDRDCHRVSINALLIPAKIAFGYRSSFGEHAVELEVAAMGYRQASIFCMRVLDSLANCFGRGTGSRDEVHDLLDEGRQIFSEIQETLAEIEEDLRFDDPQR